MGGFIFQFKNFTELISFPTLQRPTRAERNRRNVGHTNGIYYRDPPARNIGHTNGKTAVTQQNTQMIERRRFFLLLSNYFQIYIQKKGGKKGGGADLSISNIDEKSGVSLTGM